MLFESINQPFHPLTEAIEGPIKGSGPAFVLLARNGDANAVAPEVLAALATAVGFVANEATRPAFGAPAPAPFHGPAFHQGFEGHGFVPLPRGEDQRHQLAPAFRADMHFGAEAALTAAKRFGLRAPGVGPSCMLVCPDNGAIHIVDLPVKLLCGGGTLLDCGKEASPDARLAPAVEAAGDGGPAAIPLGEVTPWGACADDPQDAIEDATMVGGWATCVRFLRRKQGLSLLPLGIGKIMSVHTIKDTTQNRVCKHALVYERNRRGGYSRSIRAVTLSGVSRSPSTRAQRPGPAAGPGTVPRRWGRWGRDVVVSDRRGRPSPGLRPGGGRVGTTTWVELRKQHNSPQPSRPWYSEAWSYAFIATRPLRRAQKGGNTWASQKSSGGFSYNWLRVLDTTERS